MQNIVFFDGVCGLCNRFVNFLVSRNRRCNLTFATLQGKTAHDLIPILAAELNSIVYYRNEKVYLKSTAAIFAYSDLGGLRKIALILWIIPKFLRDWIYDFVAKNRYKWFGKHDACRIPTPAERSYFLD